MFRGFEVEKVIGSGTVQELICQTISLPAAAEEIKEIRKTVIIDNCMVVFDKVIIDGRLRKDIMFKQANAGFPLAGNVQGCVGVTTTIAGPILDIDVDIAFNAVIPVPGVCPDDKCVVLQAFVEGEKEEAANIQPTGAFTALIDKSIVFVCVKVVRDVVTHFGKDQGGEYGDGHGGHGGHCGHGGHGGHGGHCGKGGKGSHGGLSGRGGYGGCDGYGYGRGGCDSYGGRGGYSGKGGYGKPAAYALCPKSRSTGFYPGGDGSIPNAKPGLVPGTWIGPTLLFAGVLNPGVPTTLPLPNTQVAGTFPSQVQVNPVNG